MPTSRRFVAGSIVAIGIAVAAYLATIGLSFDILHGGGDSGGKQAAGLPSGLPSVAITGKQTTVFDWSRDACSQYNYADLPVRAYRDAAGQVQLILSHFTNRRMSGPSLGELHPSCDVVFGSHKDADPSQFNDREWLASPFTPDGRTVYALVHEEYHGHRHPGRCPSGIYLNCWYNAITFAESRDGGRTFQHPAPPQQLVAAVPYRYVPDQGSYGVFSPSNIVQNPKDSYYYAFVTTQNYVDQRWGSCLIRTKDLSNPQGWRAWNGSSFGVSFVDPYRRFSGKPAEHVCQPVAVNDIQQMSSSLTWSTYFKKWLLIGQGSQATPTGTVWGVFYSLSDDLIHWTPHKLIHEAEFLYTYKCGDRNPIMYPSLLDPNSTSRNFSTVGKSGWLFFTRFHYKDCKVPSNRDLVRLPVTFK